MDKIVKLKDGTFASVIKEWNWEEHPDLKIYKDNTFKERLYEDFVDVELNGQLKHTKYRFGPLPVESEFHKVLMTVCRKDVTFVNNL